MNCIKMLGLIFLAIYLILTGLCRMSEVMPMPTVMHLINLSGLVSGILLLISIGACVRKHNE